MAGSRRPTEAELRDALILGVALGFVAGVVLGAFVVGW